MPSLEFVDLPPVVSAVSGIIVRVRGNPANALRPNDVVHIEVVPTADNAFVHTANGEIAMIERITDQLHGFTVEIESAELARGYQYWVFARTLSGVDATPATVRKLGNKPACFEFGQSPVAADSTVAVPVVNFPRLVFASLPGSPVPHNADLALPGTISPFRTGMNLTCKRWLSTNGVLSDEQDVEIVIDGPMIDGQPSTFLATVRNAQLDPNKAYIVKAMADIQHQSAYITVPTLS
jgi:hypothetical protein